MLYEVTNKSLSEDSSEEPGVVKYIDLSDSMTEENLYIDTVPQTREWVILRIEQLIETIINSIYNKKPLLIKLSKFGSWRFAVLVRVLDLIHESLVSNTPVTKRNIYYRDINLFKESRIVDKIIEDIAYTFRVQRSALNVLAAAKGLVCGHIKIKRKNNEEISCLQDSEVLIPSEIEIESIEIEADWILIVEKESTFRTLVISKFYDHPIAGKGVIITAKGYPDISTREFLHMISKSISTSPSPYKRSTPILCLVDYDPYGINILATYKFGSYAEAHNSHLMAIPSIKWIGVHSSDFHKNQENGYIPMNNKDIKKAFDLLQKEWIQEHINLKNELCRMIFTRVKAEIQLLSENDGRCLTEYLADKISKGEWL
ncbi:hypothetical protein MERGE_002207 [Pneumocystis wakefieldiae]|uniref:DNA topoisomerase (ATP-hydrolyzing) n=1 Tax=Pneumocystis wakefieldiae TaxID=38082 RepID=A0A899FWA0_9ASCO|nr:hypothetical protein MERGE_002207 [Pneumocystis wakefieldiae]